MRINRMKFLAALAVMTMAVLSYTGISCGAEKKPNKEAKVIVNGASVKVHYSLKVEGSEVDTSRDKNPLEVVIGENQVIPGFEKAMMGMKEGEKKSFSIKPEDAYGPSDPQAIREVPRSSLPSDMEPKAGMMLFAKREDGQGVPVKIKEVKGDMVYIDFNHPLAGKTLNFDIEVMEVK